ncbi:LOW QUALITY PROTEIN: hypothetical protein OSB04_010721 [Centaurea solstitialis]|uniref:Uncharacterized protein n=1 Tax=Centaurea solstitialis TaxID=347529 RepID=A0AA38TR76_9ASTR|nr:LOW QUALITY PROTEIN: hypothetical protein OSB04_010721 [Centaurea solstitialis]
MIARPMIMKSKLPVSVWGHAILHTATLIRIRPTSYNASSYLKTVFGQKLNISNLRIFDCAIYVLIAPPQRTKMGPQMRLKIYVGNESTSIIRGEQNRVPGQNSWNRNRRITGSGGYPAVSGSTKMRTGTGTGPDRFRILGTGTGTTHIGSGSGTGGSIAVPVPKADTRFRCSPLSIITYLEPLKGDLFTARFADCPALGGGTKQLENQNEISWNELSYLDPQTKQCELKVQKIIQLLANQLPDTFTDLKKVTKSHVPAANAPIKINKRGRPLDSKDKNPRKKKGANHLDGHIKVNETPEKSPEETLDMMVPEKPQVPENKEISINYSMSRKVWNRDKTDVDDIFIIKR